MTARIVSPTLAARARAMLEAGNSLRETARVLGVSRQTLRRAMAAFALACATPAAASSACHPSTSPPEWAAAPGDGVLLSTTAQGMTGLVSGWLASHHAPQLVADDYQLVASPTQVLVVPVRAGFVCPGGAMVAVSREVAADLFAQMLSRSRSRA